MGSLTAHLRTPDDHGRLAFHPGCSVCRGERLAGALQHQDLVGRRAEALLAAGVLAVSSATPTATLAAAPDEEYEGTAAPEQVVAAPSDDPGFEPGGQPTDLPLDGAPPSSVEPSENPVEELTANEEPAVVDPADGTADPLLGLQEEAQAVPPPPAEIPTPAEPPVAAAPAAPDTDTATPAPTDSRDTKRKKQPRNHASEPQTVQAAPAPAPIYTPAVTAAPRTVQPQPQPAPVAATNRGQAAQRGDRFHVVRRGESLWSIASDLVGDGASPARIAREVNRLWELNSARIGTGDPDLLMVETRLALR